VELAKALAFNRTLVISVSRYAVSAVTQDLLNRAIRPGCSLKWSM